MEVLILWQRESKLRKHIELCYIYLYKWYPKQSNVKYSIGDKASDVEKQKVKAQPDNTFSPEVQENLQKKKNTINYYNYYRDGLVIRLTWG